MTGSAPTPPKKPRGHAWVDAAPTAAKPSSGAKKSAVAKKETATCAGVSTEHCGGLLHETVTACVRQYLEEIDGEPTTDFYQLVLSQVEPPLLREIMTYTRHNQTRAAEMLGLNRGTLRKKLRQYDISPDSP